MLTRPTPGWAQGLLCGVSAAIALLAIGLSSTFVEIWRAPVPSNTLALRLLLLAPLLPIALGAIGGAAFVVHRRVPLWVAAIWLVSIPVCAPGFGLAAVLWLFRGLGKGAPY